MIDGKPKPSDELRATLIIVPATLISQWVSEFEKHCQPGMFKEPIVFQGRSVKDGNITLSLLAQQDIVITSYNEVSMSYPKFNPPVELSEGEWDQWWKEHYYENRGFLHQIEWLRVVCDECTVMKNYWTHTATAVSGLIARHRWLLTGTIVTNDILEFYSYFRFLREPMAGSFENFKVNFLINKESRERLYQYLFKTMIRRSREHNFHTPCDALC
jgi:SNF2 family DNA or RNA helicase